MSLLYIYIYHMIYIYIHIYIYTYIYIKIYIHVYIYTYITYIYIYIIYYHIIHIPGIPFFPHRQLRHRGDPSHGRQHRHAAVLQLRLAQPADVDGQGEAHWVEALLAPGKSMGKSMGNPWEMLGKGWGSYGKAMGKPWEMMGAPEVYCNSI